MSAISQLLSIFSRPTLLARVRAVLHCPSRLSKEELVAHVEQYAPADVLWPILEEASRLVDHKRSADSDTLDQNAQTRSVRPRLQDVVPFDSLKEQPWDDSSFLDIPTTEGVRGLYQDFYDASSYSSLRMGLCAVCGRVQMQHDVETMQIDLADIPHLERLRPPVPHPAHTLFNGALLSPEGVVEREGQTRVQICMTCFGQLGRAMNAPPRLSLANNLWIGAVPWQLSTLTLPEQLLIAHLYPRVFVFKLFPRLGGAHFEENTLQRAMRGTVSTYALDVTGVASMLVGKLMPRPTAILASVISITYTGSRYLPQQWVRNTFRVRRYHVHQALVWLKEHNVKYYGDMDISSERITSLPEDDIPLEISSIIRVGEEENIADVEHEGYVDSEGADDRQNPAVLPLDVSGTIDTDLTHVSADEMTLWGLSNLWKSDAEGGYTVRHGQAPVNDFGRTQDGSWETENFFAKAFPCLFPYGVGGPESCRPVSLSLSEHVRWLLEYHDRRFAEHPTFPFLAFGILQRRQALLSAKVEMKRSRFERDLTRLSRITVDDMIKSKCEEEQGMNITNPDIRLLRSHVYATAARVEGSDESRYRLRSQIWSTSVIHNPPTLWMTINPSDLHDPIMQVLAGQVPSPDFLASLDAQERAAKVAQNPFAAAKYFHFIIQLIFETLFGVKVVGNRVRSRKGVLGKVSAFYGVKESQGRGTLHLHILIWLEGAPSAAEMVEKLRSEEFREKLVAFIKANIRGYVPGLESKESVEHVARNKELACQHPPDPRSLSYDEERNAFEQGLARTEQIHACRVGRCQVPDQYGHLRCKRRAPWDTSDHDFVEATGAWGFKRLYGLVNGWNPAVLINGRCNNDVKLLTNGRETKDVSYYITLYSAKKQRKTHNLSAVLAKGFEYHERRQEDEGYVRELRDQQRLLLFRLVHTINYEQELAAPMVMSYLMGWGDTYCSHRYTPIYWTSFIRYLLDRNPDLKRQQQPSQHRNQDAEEDNIRLDVNNEGRLHMQDQVADYVYRGERFSKMNIIDYFMNTYEESQHISGCDTGRDINVKDDYQPLHPRYNKSRRVLRSEGHNTIPNFLGQRFPRKDDPETYQFFCASMLLLLKPWTTLDDLKSGMSWEGAYHNFSQTGPRRLVNMISGIQYQYECETAAGEKKTERPLEVIDADDDAFDDDITSNGPVLVDNPGDVAALRLLLKDEDNAETRHGQHAVDEAVKLGLFSASISSGVENSEVLRNATAEDGNRLQQWKQQMKDELRRQSLGMRFDTESEASVSQLQVPDEREALVSLLAPEAALTSLDVSELNEGQTRAYDIVVQHLDQVLRGQSPKPLRMLIHGEGGTGKSKVIQTITKAFEARKVSSMLQKAAYTGIAASLIEGKTTHAAFGLSMTRDQKLSAESKTRMQEMWKPIVYVIIDEVSMISKTMLSRISRNLHIIKQSPTDSSSIGQSFGGVNVILAGDFHQFPPVAHPTGALYYAGNSAHSAEDALGKAIYEEFTTVILLTVQIRVTDPVWLSFLRRLRLGRVTDSDIEMLHTLQMTPGQVEAIENTFPADAPLITPRHGVRVKWNDAATEQHCQDTGRRVFVCPADDRIRGRNLTVKEKLALETRLKRSKKDKRTRNQLPRDVKLCIGMKVMVTVNVETELDVTNGARGEIVDIVLHADEPPYEINESREISLTQTPRYLLVHLARTRVTHLAGLDNSVIPIEPISMPYTIMVKGSEDKIIKRTVTRRQFPITPAYSFTDYRAQGQTLSSALIDIKAPPTGSLTLFNLYVALSRSRGRDTLRLLRGFEDDVFRKGHNTNLMEEDDRLQRLNDQTLSAYRRMKNMT